MADYFGVGMRPAGQCTCERSVTENKPVDGDACACGKRPAGMSLPLSFSTDRYEQNTDDDMYRFMHMRKSREDRCCCSRRLGDRFHHESLINLSYAQSR